MKLAGWVVGKLYRAQRKMYQENSFLILTQRASVHGKRRGRVWQGILRKRCCLGRQVFNLYFKSIFIFFINYFPFKNQHR